MTEAEWLACTNPQAMVGFLLASNTSKRKLRLFACGCCRRIWFQFKKSEASRLGVEVAERFADRQATEDELAAAHSAAVRAQRARCGYGPGAARKAVTYTTALNNDGLYFISGSVSSGASSSRRQWLEFDRDNEEEVAHLHLLRCVFSNPFRPVLTQSAWQTPTVTSLAAIAYEERSLPSGELDPTRLAVLADALEESGCHNADILNHLRGPGPHVRGCWPLDLVLEKNQAL